MTSVSRVIPQNNLFVPHDLGKVSVAYDGLDFLVADKEGCCKVQRAFLSSDLRGVSPTSLDHALQHGYLSLAKAGDTYTIRYNDRLNGGGPVAGACTFLGMVLGGAAVAAAGAVTLNPALVYAGSAVMAAAVPASVVVAVTPTP